MVSEERENLFILVLLQIATNFKVVETSLSIKNGKNLDPFCVPNTIAKQMFIYNFMVT